MQLSKKWWHDKVAYQIYPKSFLDTNGDGIGDLRGIISKLDYLKQLGVDIIWISPIYRSPFVDQGYDISDYYDIDPAFGTMADFDLLLAEAKKRDMYIVMDLVINHCSDKHEWFQKALADPHGAYGDYFYFRPGKNGGPPNNLRSYFGGSCWEKVPGQEDLYYFHAFAREQPDLNWENPALLQELYNMVNWWLEKGVAGFRIDAIINIQKDPAFPDYPADSADGTALVTKMVESVSGIGEKLQALKANTFARHDAFTVAEVFNMRKDELLEFVGEEGHFSTMFDFSANCLSDGEKGWYSNKSVAFADFRRTVFASQRECMGVCYLANIIENHDEPRGSSRYLPAHAQNRDGMKMLGTVSVLLRGLPFLYQGQELGMTNCPMDSLDEYDDISTKNEYRVAVEAGLTHEEAMDVCLRNSRDNSRTPMQWSGEKNAGFTAGTPWLKVNPNYVTVNAAAQEQDPDSLLRYYRSLLALRKSEAYGDVFTRGDFTPRFAEEDMVFAYERTLEGKSALVLANFGAEAVTLTAPDLSGRPLLLANGAAERNADSITLSPCRAAVLGSKE